MKHNFQVLAAVQGIQHPHSSVDPLAASEQGDRPDEALLYQVIIPWHLNSILLNLCQALEGKKKVLLELRQDTVASPRPQPQQQQVQQVQQVQVQEQLHQQVEQHQQQQVIYLFVAKSLFA